MVLVTFEKAWMGYGIIGLRLPITSGYGAWSCSFTVYFLVKFLLYVCYCVVISLFIPKRSRVVCTAGFVFFMKPELGSMRCQPDIES